MSEWTVSLELPEVEGADPVDAARNFCLEAGSGIGWFCVVTDNRTGAHYDVDLATGEAIQR